jgi:hypothetical protein
MQATGATPLRGVTPLRGHQGSSRFLVPDPSGAPRGRDSPTLPPETSLSYNSNAGTEREAAETARSASRRSRR